MKDEHDILKEELTRGIDLDKIYQESGGKPIPTYKKLAGLVNLGKTYFINFGEVRKAHDWAQTQMTNKYGAELYGVNAQLAQQRNDGTGNILDGRSSLITCNVSTMYNLPKDGFVKEASGEYLDFKNTLEKFDKFLKDRDWDKDHTSDYNDFAKIADEFNVNLDGDSDVNKKAWGDFMKLMKKEPWKSNLVKGNKLYDHFKQLKLAYDQWDIGGSAKGSKDELFGRASGDSGNGWMPLVTCKIDVRTNFGEEWFKRTGAGWCLAHEISWRHAKAQEKLLEDWGWRRPDTKVWNYWDEDSPIPLRAKGLSVATLAMSRADGEPSPYMSIRWTMPACVSPSG